MFQQRKEEHMADVSQLNLAQPDSINWDEYQDGGKGFAPPPAGRYWGIAPESFTFKPTQERKLMAVIDPITIAPGQEGAGYQVRFSNASVKKFEKREGSMLGDYLRSHGIVSQPRTNEEYAALVESTAGRQFEFMLNWEAYCKQCQTTAAKGFKNFPNDGNGGKVSKIKCPHCDTEVYANGKATAFISAVGGE